MAIALFFEKARQAEIAGAVGIVVLSDTENPYYMGAPQRVNLLAISAGASFGAAIADASKNGPVVISVAAYTAPWLKLTFGVLLLFACGLVAAGAYFSVHLALPITSTTTTQQSVLPTGGAPSTEQGNAREDDTVEIDARSGVCFCVVGSCVLVLLFYFMWIAIYVIIAVFCFGGANCVTSLCGLCFGYFVPSLKREVALPWYGPVSRADLLGSIPALALTSCWLVLRNSSSGWIFQDIIGACFLLTIQRSIQIPDLRVATVILSIMLCFDVFWTFISPMFFSAPSSSGNGTSKATSVMVHVATGGGTGEAIPMLLRFPTIGDQFSDYEMLGFGDIAIPGLLISFLYRYDVLSKKRLANGYFAPAVFGYCLGMLGTALALFVMNQGQPALLYLVPFTLGITFILGFARGELRNLWQGKPTVDSQERGQLQDNLLKT
jgi:signal peptide peptidase-like protein 2B